MSIEKPYPFGTIPEITTPAEAKFWQEWADKAPAMIRMNAKVSADQEHKSGLITVSAVSIGVALGIATFTKYIPKKWKLVSGLASAGALTVGMVNRMSQGFYIDKGGDLGDFERRIDVLESNPEHRKMLANYLSSQITAEDIQEKGIDKAVLDRAKRFVALSVQLSPRENFAAIAKTDGIIGR